MLKRTEKALELADTAINQIEAGTVAPDTQDLMSYALILVLADISEQLADISDTLSTIELAEELTK